MLHRDPGDWQRPLEGPSTQRIQSLALIGTCPSTFLLLLPLRCERNEASPPLSPALEMDGSPECFRAPSSGFCVLVPALLALLSAGKVVEDTALLGEEDARAEPCLSPDFGRPGESVLWDSELPCVRTPFLPQLLCCLALSFYALERWSLHTVFGHPCGMPARAVLAIISPLAVDAILRLALLISSLS